MATVKQTFTGDKNQLEQAYKDLAQQVVRLEQANVRLAQRTEDMNRQAQAGTRRTSDSLLNQTHALASVAVGWLGVQSAIESANASIEEHFRISKEAGDLQTRLARAQATAALNVSDPALFQEIQSQSATIVKRTGFPDLPTISEALGGSIGAAGGDKRLAFEATEIAASLTKHRPDLLGRYSLGMLDVGTTGKLSARDSAALLMRAGDFARVDNPDLQIKSIAESIAGGAAAASASDPEGLRRATEQSAELWAALNYTAKDTEGSVSRTTSVRLQSQLSRFFEEGFDETIAGRKFSVKPKSDPGTPIDRLAMVANDPRLSRTFLSRASFGEIHDPILRAYFRDPNKSELAQNLFRAAGEVSYDPAIVDDKIGRMESGTATLKRSSTLARDASENQLRESGQVGLATDADARMIRDEVLAKTRSYSGAPGLLAWPIETAVNKIDDALAYFKIISPERSAMDALRQRQSTIRGDKELSELSPKALQDYEYVGQKLDKIAALLEAQNMEMTQSRPAAGPAANAEVGGQRER